MDFMRNTKVSVCLAYASSTAARNGAILDMAGYEGVMAIITLATQGASAVGDFHWEQDTAVGGGTMADLLGTAMVIGADDDDEVWISDLYRPQERYVRGVITKDASHAQAASVTYIQYGGHKGPITTGADESERTISPAEGTK